MKGRSRIVTVPQFSPQPIKAEPVPQCPALAPNGRNNMHNDAYMSDTYTWSGPLGGRLELGFAALPGLCATLTFDKLGRIITVCSGVTTAGVSRTLRMLDPDTLETVTAIDLPAGGGGSTGFGGGGYIFLNNKEQAVTPTANQEIWIVDIDEKKPGFKLAQRFDLSKVIGHPEASLQSAMPDWSGRIWWVTDTGVVGYTDPGSGASWAIQLPSPQQIGNSFAVDETGGVFIASNYAQYRFDVEHTGQLPIVTWCYSYDRGTRMKPGQQNFGTGTTPTLVGSNYCGITDNADPMMHVVVYRRDKDFVGNRIVCEVPVFAPGFSDTENSLIGYTGNFYVENNYGYTGTFTIPTGPVTPGLARVRFDNTPCPGEKVWENNAIVIPSVVSKLSLASGLLHSYTLEIEDKREHWYFSAVDAATGEVAYKALAGTGLAYDNHYASLFIGPNGTVYVPVWSGIAFMRQA